MNEPLDPQAKRIMSESYPSDQQLLWATNYMSEAYDHYVWTMAQARMRPASIVDWTHSIIAMWEKPTHG